MADEDPFRVPGWTSIGGDVRGEAGLQAFLGSAMSQDAEEIVVAGGVTHVDVVTATAAALRTARHRRTYADGQLTLRLPTSTGPRQALSELLHATVDGLTVDPVPAPDHVPRRCLLPATAVGDRAAAIDAAEYAAQAATLPGRQTHTVFSAVAELSINAFTHAINSPVAPVVAATVSELGRVDVAVSDLGCGISEAEDPAAQLDALRASETNFLGELLRQGQRLGLPIHIEVMAGTARMRWTWSNRTIRASGYVPGTTVVVRIGAP